MTLRPRYLLHTTVCIALVKHLPPQVAERFSSCMVGEVLISVITAAELEYGVVASAEDAERNRVAFDRFLREVPINASLGRDDFQANPPALRMGLMEQGFLELSIQMEHVLAVEHLPRFHRDPHR